MIAELLLAGSVLADGADLRQPAATLTVTYQGKAMPLGPKAAALLRGDLEELLSGCSLAEPATGEAARGELEVTLSYGKPKRFATITRGHPRMLLGQLRLTASSAINEGWPQFYGAGPGTNQQFFKCQGGKILDTLCTPALQPLIPAKVRDNCGLAPRRRTGNAPHALNTE